MSSNRARRFKHDGLPDSTDYVSAILERARNDAVGPHRPWKMGCPQKVRRHAVRKHTFPDLCSFLLVSLRQFDHVSFRVFQSPSESCHAFTASSQLRRPPSHDVHLSAILFARGVSVLSTTSWNSTCLCQACSVLSTVFFIVDSRHHVPLCSRISSCLLGISLGRVFTIFANAVGHSVQSGQKQKCLCLPSRSGPSSAPTILGFFLEDNPSLVVVSTTRGPAIPSPRLLRFAALVVPPVV